MNDHKADAEKLIGDVDTYLDDHRSDEQEAVGVAIATGLQAQAAATLMLADQHRTANMIAAHKVFGRNPVQWPSEVREGCGL